MRGARSRAGGVNGLDDALVSVLAKERDCAVVSSAPPRGTIVESGVARFLSRVLVLVRRRPGDRFVQLGCELSIELRG
ncbi:hypothetical protein [Pseudenhygromyxa sp. WMMC2535]|uniref:hypothetical protein n=1 Tax=Pseudenhygromyxa sp. WMMC2535 TaxID=2712867 RepID=UPI001C3CE43E|nr:hypothetical protein [Pseudenhygromyxa sp. WMMC2535]